MKTVTLLEFSKNAEGILRRVAQGERFLLSHRGRLAARLEPVTFPIASDCLDDHFLTSARRAVPSPKGKTKHQEIDLVLYGGRLTAGESGTATGSLRAPSLPGRKGPQPSLWRNCKSSWSRQGRKNREDKP